MENNRPTSLPQCILNISLAFAHGDAGFPMSTSNNVSPSSATSKGLNGFLLMKSNPFNSVALSRYFQLTSVSFKRAGKCKETLILP